MGVVGLKTVVAHIFSLAINSACSREEGTGGENLTAFTRKSVDH